MLQLMLTETKMAACNFESELYHKGPTLGAPLENTLLRLRSNTALRHLPLRRLLLQLLPGLCSPGLLLDFSLLLRALGLAEGAGARDGWVTQICAVTLLCGVGADALEDPAHNIVSDSIAPL